MPKEMMMRVGERGRAGIGTIANDSRRYRCWVARVTPEARAPGGLAREFSPAPNEVPEDWLVPGAVIERGAKDLRGDNRPRGYRVVTARQGPDVVCQGFGDDVEAALACARQVLAPPLDPLVAARDRVAAARAELAAAEAALAALEDATPQAREVAR